jgi:hypothetical protein
MLFMITIFGDFWQFSAKKLAFYQKSNVMIKILHNLALFWVKNANILKIITSVPGKPGSSMAMAQQKCDEKKIKQTKRFRVHFPARAT